MYYAGKLGNQNGTTEEWAKAREREREKKCRPLNETSQLGMVSTSTCIQ